MHTFALSARLPAASLDLPSSSISRPDSVQGSFSLLRDQERVGEPRPPKSLSGLQTKSRQQCNACIGGSLQWENAAAALCVCVFLHDATNSEQLRCAEPCAEL